LHCYLSSANSIEDDYTQGVLFVLDKYEAAIEITNNSGWLPVHLAAINDRPLDVLFDLVKHSLTIFPLKPIQ